MRLYIFDMGGVLLKNFLTLPEMAGKMGISID